MQSNLPNVLVTVHDGRRVQEISHIKLFLLPPRSAWMFSREHPHYTTLNQSNVFKPQLVTFMKNNSANHEKAETRSISQIEGLLQL